MTPPNATKSSSFFKKTEERGEGSFCNNSKELTGKLKKIASIKCV